MAGLFLRGGLGHPVAAPLRAPSRERMRGWRELPAECRIGARRAALARRLPLGRGGTWCVLEGGVAAGLLCGSPAALRGAMLRGAQQLAPEERVGVARPCAVGD